MNRVPTEKLRILLRTTLHGGEMESALLELLAYRSRDVLERVAQHNWWRDKVKQEMAEHTARGELVQCGHMPSWPKYEAALQAMNVALETVPPSAPAEDNATPA